MQELATALKSACHQLFGIEIEPDLERPAEKFGDYATNLAMQLAPKTGKNPREIAEALAVEAKNIPGVAEASVAGPGFLNFKLTDEKLAAMVGSATDLPKPLDGQEIVVEYSDPNPFKVLHIGHIYTSVVGDAIANLLELAGANVHRVNFGGDVGLHVAKTMWAILQKLGGENPEKLNEVPKSERPEWLSEQYVTGSFAYGEEEKFEENRKREIQALNIRIYEIHEKDDHSSPLAQIYWTTRQWSYDYFEDFYAKIGTKFEKYYPESETVQIGLDVVRDNMGEVFQESDGAVVFKGEVHNLHTRVFINSQGLPTYETKDVGLIFKKWDDYHFDKSIVITGNEIYEYMQVVLKAIEAIKPELAQRTQHLTHGMVKLAGGEKMSSRKGNILMAEEIIKATGIAYGMINKEKNDQGTLGAIKYAFLKNSLGPDLIFNSAESVSIQGNSGPYLQYAHARACSILDKAGEHDGHILALQPGERTLARKISEYPEAVAKATAELMPHHICTYLYELAQTFNRFYENNRVVGDERQGPRLALVSQYKKILKHGLGLLNISAPEHI